MEAVMKQARATTGLEDAEVIERVAHGEKGLYEILMRRYNQTLFRAIRSYLPDRKDVEDAMQETYLKAYAKLGQFIYGRYPDPERWRVDICFVVGFAALGSLKYESLGLGTRDRGLLQALIDPTAVIGFVLGAKLGMRVLRTKRVNLPKRKHGNIPL